jgi:hypothetical protein
MTMPVVFPYFESLFKHFLLSVVALNFDDSFKMLFIVKNGVKLLNLDDFTLRLRSGVVFVEHLVEFMNNFLLLSYNIDYLFLIV